MSEHETMAIPNDELIPRTLAAGGGAPPPRCWV